MDLQSQMVRDVFLYSILFRLYLYIWHEIGKHNDETDTLFVNKTT
jgi:hypothetical protein